MLNEYYQDRLPLSGTAALKFPSESTSGGLSDSRQISNPSSNTVIPPARSWSVGKVSVLLLLLFSLTDVVLDLVDAQMDSLEAPDHYDALSADVIRPAFRYHGSDRGSKQHRRRPSMGLGSAAISSVTTALSPILPFTGGLDLRREDYWTNGWFGSVTSVLQQVRDAFEGSSSFSSAASSTLDGTNQILGTPRGGGAVAGKTRRGPSKSVSKKNDQANFVFSNSEPFIPHKEIAGLTLKDITAAFRYAVHSSRKDFAAHKFSSGLVPRSKKVVDRIAEAVSTARGKGVAAPVTGEPDDQDTSTDAGASGDIDALKFCAAMRIFAEWRVLRQVPPGYKGYAVGISLGQKDIVQNIAKIEHAIHSFMEHRVREEEERIHSEEGGTEVPMTKTIASPTLRDLLQYELDIDFHDNTSLPRLKEKSAAMGLLWVRRQLQYQTALFKNVPDVPNRFETTRAAVQNAYDEVYHNYHGWAVQKIFSYSFQAAPEASIIYKYMNPHRLEEATEEARAHVLGEASTHSRRGRHSFQDSTNNEESGVNPFDKLGRHIGKEWDKLAGNVVNEWDKMAKNVGQLFGQPKASLFLEESIEAQTMNANEDVEIEKYVDHAMKTDAYEHISAYLEVARPILDDLAFLFDEYNMDDPTKV